MRILACSLVLFSLLAPPAMADIFKCVLEDGTVKFSDVPCSDDAKVAFETDEQKTFDVIIGQGYVLPNMPLDPALITTEGVIEHAKKIAACIIPGEYINGVKTYPSESSNGSKTHETKKKAGYKSSIELHIGPDETKKYIIRMGYNDFTVKREGIYLYLHYIEIFREGHRYDPPSLSNSRKFLKVKTGRYESTIDHHFPYIQYD